MWKTTIQGSLHRGAYGTQRRHCPTYCECTLRVALRNDSVDTNERDGIVLEPVLGGSSVQDGVVHIAPSVTGLWTGSDRTVDPARQKPSVSISPTAALREGLSNVKLDILGVKDSGAYIGLVTDAATKSVDGQFTPGGIVVITGDKLRIAPLDEPGLGIFFVDEKGNPGSRVFDPLAPLSVLTLAPGESVTFKHLIVVQTNGYLTDADLNRLSEDFCNHSK